MARVQTVDEIHGGDKARFGGVAAHEEAVRIVGRGIEGLHDAAVQGDFCGEVGEVEIT